MEGERERPETEMPLVLREAFLSTIVRLFSTIDQVYGLHTLIQKHQIKILSVWVLFLFLFFLHSSQNDMRTVLRRQHSERKSPLGCLKGGAASGGMLG